MSDEDALRALARDLSDIPADTLRRAREGFRRAYEEADMICRGDRDPLSSR